MSLQIRPERSEDQQAIWHVHRAAFGADDEARLVNALRDGGFVAVSLVAQVNDEVVGHILFSKMSIAAESGVIEALSLAPMAVAPNYQRKGIGSRLVDAGLGACRENSHRIVLVLGHPDFYPRFGFSADLAQPLISPFGGGNAWMAVELVPDALKCVSGKVQFASPFAELE